jgi:hypothetical protein
VARSQRIGGEERVDAATEARFTSERRQAYEAERQSLEAMLRRSREELPLAERLAKVLGQIARLQTRPAGPIGRSPGGGGKATSREPPAAEHLEGIHRPLRLITAHIATLEHLVDVHLGITVAKTRQNLTGPDKDRILFGADGEPSDFEGMHADDVAEVAPYLGSSRTIRRLRADRGLDIRGHPRDEPA